MFLTLIKKEKILGNIRTFIFKPDKDFAFVPGQFMRYFLPHKNTDKKGDNRYFTISSAPFEKYIQITTRFDNLPVSSFKQALWDLPIGGRIEASGPEGEFIVKPKMRKLVLLAGGIGITPFRSMVAELNHTGEISSKSISLVYANKDKNIVFGDELDQISAKNLESFRIEYIFDPRRIDTKVLKNYMTDDTYYLVSGPKPFVDAMKDLIFDLKIDLKYFRGDFFPGYEKY